MQKVLFAVIGNAETSMCADAAPQLRALCDEAGVEAVLLRFVPGRDGAFRLGVHPEAGGMLQVTLESPEALGYGERAKLSFDYALEQGLDAVVILDGELRYPLEVVRDLLGPVLRAEADMVLGIPARGKERAPTGPGLPRYLVQPGARFTSRLLNSLTKAKLRGWHCGFRAYNARTLARLPYGCNASSRMFNTEIIIQYLLCGLSIAEVPAPGYTHQGLGFWKKVRFALEMLRASGLSVLHRMSLFYQRQFDLVEPIDVYGLKLGYASSHTMALEQVPPGSRVLDIGCGDGSLAGILRQRGCTVYGMDQHEISACPGLDGYTRMDLDVKHHTFQAAGYDRILLLDVLEHLRFPEKMLEHIRQGAAGAVKPLLVISVPNVAFFIIRLRLLLGSFHYGKLGILDLTHTRLFTEAAIRQLLRQTGYSVESVAGIPAPYPKAIGDGWASRLLLTVNQWLIGLSRGAGSYQLLITARPRPCLRDFNPAGTLPD